MTDQRLAATRFWRSAGIGLAGHILILILLVAGLILAGRLGGEGGATAAALSFLPALILLDALYLVVVVLIAAVPALRARTGSGPGLLVGWLAGAALVAAVIAALFNLV